MAYSSMSFRRVLSTFLAGVFSALLLAGCELERNQTPRELKYCLKMEGNGAEQNCLESATLKIPAIYYDGYPLDFSEITSEKWQELSVSYPDMQPWHSIPFLDRKTRNKVEIRINGVSSSPPKQSFEIYFLGRRDIVKMPAPIYGLDGYIRPESWLGQMYLPIEDVPRTYAICAYDEDPEKDQMNGCMSRTLVDIQHPAIPQDPPLSRNFLSVSYRYKRAWLYDWKEMHWKVDALVKSFASK